MEGGFRNPITTILAPGVVDSDAIADGAITSIKIANNLQSDNWNGTTVAAMDATQGWRIEKDTGDFGAENVVLRGTIFATTGELGDLDVVGDLTMQSGGVIQTAPSSDRHLLLRTDASPNGSIIQWVVPGGTHAPAGIYSVDADAGAGVIEQVVWVGPELSSNPGKMGIAINENGPITVFAENTPTNPRLDVSTQIRVIDGSSTSHSITRLNSPNNEGIYFNTQGLVVEIAGALVGEFYDNGLRLASPASPNDPAFPSLTFDVDVDTGLYRAAANTLGLSAGGTGVVSITPTDVTITGDLFVGTTNGMARIVDVTSVPYTFVGDTNTGFGWLAADQAALIAGGNDALRFNDEWVVTGTLSGSNTIRFHAAVQGGNNVRAGRFSWATSTTTNRILDIVSSVGGAGTTRAFVEADGDWFNTNGTYGTISDRRLKVKSSIKSARSYLDDLNRIRIVNYRLKNDKQKLLGVVADEVASIFPELVKEGEGGIAEVKTSVFIPMLITALQELTERVEELENVA